ncbi:MAG: hypothetical protein Q7S32_04700 [bacterium]|nr:hypothetical protein [bacterium]
MENPANLEQEIADIEKRLAEKKAALQESHDAEETPSDKAVLHEVVGEKIQEMSPQGLPTVSAPVQPVTPPPPPSDPPAHLSEDLKNQIQTLVNITFTKSLADALKELAKIENPALLDAFHDVLVDQLYDTLVERGKLEKI